MSDQGITLLLARHGRTEWNSTGRYQGRSDPPLSLDGEAEALALASRIATEPLAAVLSSPLRRARHTATIAAERLGMSAVQVDPLLVEIAYGAWEGLTQAEVKARWPAQLRIWKHQPEAMRFPAGETLAQARRRLTAFLAKLVGLPAGSTCLVVTHSGLIRLAMLMAHGLPIRDFRSIHIEPCGVRRLMLRTEAGATPILSAIQEN